MGVEILWFRHLGVLLGSFRSVFSLLLGVILIGIWLGSMIGGYCHRRMGKPLLLYMLTQTAFIVSTVALLATVGTTEVNLRATPPWPTTAALFDLWTVYMNLRPIFLMVGLPALFMGFAFPLANAAIQRAQNQVGRRAGMLYLANTTGAVAGSVVTGFVLIPFLGIHGSVLCLVLVGCGALIGIYLAGRASPEHRRLLGAFTVVSVLCVAIGLGTAALWRTLPGDRLLRFGIPPGDKVLSISEGVGEVIVVSDDPRGKARRLNTNGHPMSTTSAKGQRYMRAFSHIPLLNMDDPKRAVVICFGVGSTLNAASLHRSIERLEIVDLSRHVLEHAGYFEQWNGGVLKDPRVKVFVNDGRLHLWMQPEDTYDLITLEPPPIAYAGVSALYTREFYELARSRLRPGGYMSQWLPAYQVPEHVVRSMIRAFIDVFPNSVLLSGHSKEMILLGIKGPSITIDPNRLLAKLQADPVLAKDLDQIRMGTPLEIVGTFMGSAEAMEKATEGYAPVTDDFPLIEYAAFGKTCGRMIFPRDLIDLGAMPQWCPKCYSNGSPAPPVGLLDKYLVFLGDYYAQPAFWDNRHCEIVWYRSALDLDKLSDVIDGSRYLSSFFGH
jgi:spermidine synthase